MNHQDTPPGWRTFESPNSPLTIAIPPSWNEIRNPDTVVSLASADYLGLIEVFRYTGGKTENLADFVAQANVDISPFEEGFQYGRVFQHSEGTLGSGVRLHRVHIGYEEKGRGMEVHYIVVGIAHEAIQMGLKSTVDRTRFYKDDFERMSASLRTDWLPNGPVAAG